MAQNRVAGFIYLRIDGVQRNAYGNFTYHLGTPTREEARGESGIDGYTEQLNGGMIEGEIRDQRDLDLDALRRLDGVTITLELANGKVISLPDAWECSDGTQQTRDGNVKVKFMSKRQAREIS